MMNKTLRAGFQGKRDSMREMADRLMAHSMKEKDEYKHGGHVKKSTKSKSSCNPSKQRKGKR